MSEDVVFQDSEDVVFQDSEDVVWAFINITTIRREFTKDTIRREFTK